MCSCQTVLSDSWREEKKNKFTGCALSVGCTLLQASMNHSKGGSENVCVKNDTGAALALSCQGCCTSDLQQGFQIWHFSSCNVAVFSLHFGLIPVFIRVLSRLNAKNLRKNIFSRPLLRGRMWVYVGGSTHRVGLRSAMTHPSALSLSLCSEAWWNSTHKHTGLNTSCRLSIRAEMCHAGVCCERVSLCVCSTRWH